MIRIFYFIFLTLLVFSCTNDNELETQAYPILRTLSVTNISAEGATLNGEFLNTGNEEILRYGFVYDLNDPDVEHSDTIIISREPKESAFAIPVDDAFAANLTYKVRFFAITTNHILYGNTVEFLSKGSKWNPWIFVNKYPIVATDASILVSASNNENAILVTEYGYSYSYNPKNNQLFTCRVVPYNVVGGIHSHNYTCYYEGENFYNLDLTDNVFFRYFRPGNSWVNLGAPMPDLPGKRCGFSIGENGYFISTGKMYLYDKSHHSWISKTPLSATNIIYSVLVNDLNAYVLTDNQEIWNYSPSSDSWQKETEFPGTWQENIIGFAVNNKLYYGLSYKPTYISGYPQYAASIDFWEYSIETKTWKRMKNFPMEHSKNAVVNFSIQDIGYFGFFDDHQFYLYKFDPDKVR